MKQSPNDKNKWPVFFLVAIGIFMATLDGSIVNIALPAIMKDLQVPLATTGWVMMIYLLTVSSLLLTFGRLSDIKGRRWVFCRGFIIFSLGSLFCGMARSALWLIMARSFQGVGAAMIMACSPALITDTFPVLERGKALGMVGTVVAAGLTTGPALGGLILDLFSWRLIFYINIPIGIGSTALAVRILKGGRGDLSRAEPFDWAGAVLLSVCLCTVIITLNRISDWGYTSWRLYFIVGVSIFSAIGLVRVETRTRYPIFEPSLLKIRLFTYPILSAILLYASLFTMIFLMPFYLVHPSGFPMDRAGYTMVIPFVFLFFVSPLAGTISDRIGSRLLCALGMVVMTAALFSLARLSPSSSPLPVAWRLALAGIGTALFVSPNSAAVMSAVPMNRRGIASGMVATARNIGMVVGVTLAGLVFSSIFRKLSGGESFKIYHSELEPIFLTAFHHAMLAGGLVAGLGVVVALLRGSEKA
jgi:EmrB/QacA subfamily drug resistance transporter